MQRDTARRRWRGKSCILVFPMLLAAGLALADGDMVSGTADVIDADILKIGAQRVILWGIDAPERAQVCGLNGEQWGCYDSAKRALELLAGRGEVSCTFKGPPDPFGRRFGVCESGGQDLGAEMVRQGMALAYLDQSDDYEAVQLEAITAGVGLWQPGVVFEEPWVFRMHSTPGGFR
jgi:endonuclease YncB( thermonuclease family)